MEQTVVAEAKANQITANFEQAGHPAVQSARYVMDLPGSSAGKFMIYAPSVSSGGAIIGIQRSNVVTWNGGVSDEFRPVVMGVTGDHRTTRLSIDAVGAGLSSVQSGKLQSADTSWAVPLQVVTATDSSITLEADVPVQLPDAILTVDPADTITAAASLFSLLGAGAAGAAGPDGWQLLLAAGGLDWGEPEGLRVLPQPRADGRARGVEELVPPRLHSAAAECGRVDARSRLVG